MTIMIKQLGSDLVRILSLAVVTPNERPDSKWIRIYCPLGMADLFRAYVDGRGEVHVDCGHGDTLHIDESLILPIGMKIWRETELCVPCDVQGTLEKRYGSDWKVPKYMDK